MKHLKTGLLFIGSVFLLISCQNAEQGDATKSDTAIEQEVEKEIVVRTDFLKVREISVDLDYTANLIAYKDLYLAPATPGRIDRILVDVGDRVKKGQLLVEMDRSQLIQAKLQLSQLEIDFARMDTLWSNKAISKQQYDQIKTQYEVTKESVGFLEENTRMVAPFDGIVTSRLFENNELYSGAPNTQAGKAAILILNQIRPMKAMVNISQSYYPKIKKGMTASITTDIYPESTFEGKITRVYPVIDQYTRTFKAELIIKNESELLRPGMYANIGIKLMDTQALVVPASAVLKQQGTNNRYIFIHENGVAQQVFVELGKRYDEVVEIKSEGLSEGLELVVDGQSKLLNGSKIKVVTE